MKSKRFIYLILMLCVFFTGQIILGDDFGDAPESYRTLLADDGPRHVNDGVNFLGERITDDTDGFSNGIDESENATDDDGDDGVNLGGVSLQGQKLLIGETIPLEISVSGNGGVLSAWIDFNGNGRFDTGEQVIDDELIFGGSRTINIEIPSSQTPIVTYARFRYCTSTDECNVPIGLASSGEVEDYEISLIEDIDYGDAPESYRTLLRNNGARHVNDKNNFLGTVITSDVDGFSNGIDINENATDDDGDDGITIDGVSLQGQKLELGSINELGVEFTGDPGFLNVWIDLNGDGDFSDGNEQILNDHIILFSGNVELDIPSTELPLSKTYARFRYCITAGECNTPIGLANSGEVEDYEISLFEEIDYGDAPESYGTLFKDNGARHTNDGINFLGSSITTDVDGFSNGIDENKDASDDDGDDGITIDGISLQGQSLRIGETVSLDVEVSGSAGLLNAWIDFNGDGDFNDAGEQILNGMVVGSNGTSINLEIPLNQAPMVTYARFRYCTVSGECSTPIGLASSGEVEDYEISFFEEADYGDAPESYGTLFKDNGARHTNDGVNFLGSSITTDIDGFSNGIDDNGDASDDDGDDGITIGGTSLQEQTLILGQTNTLNVDISGSGGILNAWIDFNGDGDFSDAGEQIAIEKSYTGSGTLDITIPDTAIAGNTFARFRYCTVSGECSTPIGLASSGEVEDYQISIYPQELDCAQEGILVQGNRSAWIFVDMVTGTSTVTDDNINYDFNAIGFNVKDNLVWGYNWNRNDGRLTVTGKRGDGSLVTGLTAPIPGLPRGGYIVGDVDQNGFLYLSDTKTVVHVIDLNRDSENFLEIVRTSNVGRHGPDWAFHPKDGMLYSISEDKGLLLQINPETGASINLGPAGVATSGGHGAVFFDKDGFFYTSHNISNGLYRVDLREDPGNDYDESKTSLFATINNNSQGHNDGARCVLASVDFDAGDAPESYGTLLADDGPRHGNDNTNFLGSSITNDTDGFVDGIDDNGDATDDDGDDGVTINGVSLQDQALIIGETNTLNVDISGSGGLLNAWIDFNGDGDFSDEGEHIADEVSYTDSGTLDIVVPDTAIGGNTFARFRYCTTAGDCNSLTGAASNGEVEDYQIKLSPIAIEKTTVGDPVLSEDGNFSITYEIEVVNLGAEDTSYDLEDTLKYGGGITPEKVVVNSDELSASLSFETPADDLSLPLVIQTNHTIAGGVTHTYTIVVTGTYDTDTISSEDGDCNLIDGEEGTGFLNEAKITVDGEEITDEVCEPIDPTDPSQGNVFIEKVVSSGPDITGNNFVIDYQIRVTNNGELEDNYDLSDQLKYGQGLTVATAQVTAASANVTTVNLPVNLSTSAPVEIVSDEPIEVGATETFDIRVTGTVDTDLFTGEEADCQIEGNEQGTGFLNETELTVNDNVVIETACPEEVTVEKTVVGDLVLSEDGNFSITYEIKVENSGEATSYDLKDTLKYGGGITPEKAVIKSDRLSSDLIFEEPGDDLTSELTIVTEETINQGEVHTYIVVVTGTFDSDEITDNSGDCDLDTGTGGTGFLNEATVEIDGEEVDNSEACKPIDPVDPPANNIFLEKIVVSGPDITGNNFVIDYQIRVTNNGEERASYDLSDELKYGKGLVVSSSQVINVSSNVTGVTPPVDLNPGSKSEIVVGEEIEVGDTETFDIRVSGTVDTDIFTGEEADCQIEENEQGTGFLNETELTVDENVVIETVCPEEVTVEKTVVGDLVLSEDGNFSITYEIEVENSGEATSYDLKDTLKYGGGITPEKAVIKSDRLSSDLIFEEPGDDLTSELTIVTEETINQGEVHTYIVVVTGTFESDEITTDGGDCDLEGGESGTGFLNEATVEIDGEEETDTACKPIDPVDPPANNIFLEKIVVSGPDITGNNFVIDYQIRVTNNGEERASYDLSDELKYGKGLVVSSSQVINVSSNVTGVTPPVDLNPGSKSEIVVGEEIEAGDTETFDIRVSGTVDTDIFTGEEADCQIEENEQGTGFLNETELTVDENVVIETVCPEEVTVKKTVVGDLVLSEDGNFSITYEIEVENSGEATSYDLKDTLKYGGGITPEKAVIKSDRLSSDLIFEEPGDDLTSELTIVTEETINQGEVHTYIVVVTGTFESDEITTDGGDCDLEGGESGTGFLNEATVEIDGEPVDNSEACKPIDPVDPPANNIFLEKIVVSGPDITGNNFVIDYQIRVTNNGEERASYDLSDELKYGKGLVVSSSQVINVSSNVTGVTPPVDLNPGSKSEIVVGEEIEVGDTETFDIRVSGTVDTDIFTGEEADCQIEENEQGTGFLNETELTVDENVVIETVCPEEVTVKKTVVGDLVLSEDGNFSITYEIEVENSGEATSYDLKDTLKYGGGITPEKAVIKSDRLSSDLIFEEPGDDLTSELTIVTEETINQGEVHTYIVVVTGTFESDEITTDGGDCDLEGGESGTGFLNEATVEIDGEPVDNSEACKPIDPETPENNNIFLEKVVVSGPDITGNSFVIDYQIRVTNNGEERANYDLSDELKYGKGLVINSSQVINVSSNVTGVTPPVDLNPGSKSEIVVGEEIEVGDTETFDIRVSGTVDTDIFTGEEADCQIEENEQGTGFLNETELTVDENVVIETACPEDVSVDKVVVGDLVLSEDGNFSITYEIKVENSGEATSYDLKDTLKYGGGITPEKVVVKSDRLSSDLIFEEPGDDLTSELTIVTGETINQGEVHTYIVVVTGTFESDEITTDGGDCDLEGGESGTGFLNEATVEIDGGDSTDTACKPIDPETPENNNIFLEKIVVSGPDITGNSFVIDYQIRVTNNGEERANYDLSDELKYGKGLVINSSQVINVSSNVTGVTPPVDLNPGSKSEIVVGEEIEAGETETFDIRVSGTVDTDIFTGEEADCQIEENEQGTGFLNETELTVDENVVIETACPEDVSVDKVVVGDLVLSEDGNFSITYEIKVENSGEATSYDLKDTLKYGGGITPEKVVVKSDRLSSDLIFEEPGDDLTSELTIVTGETINQGEVHTYIVVVTGTFESDEITTDGGDCDLEGGESGTGFLNEATVEIDGGDSTDTACKPIDPETPENNNIFLEKIVVSGPDITGNSFVIDYQIRVTNNGEERANYDLSDELKYGKGLVINSSQVINVSSNVTGVTPPVDLDPGSKSEIVVGEEIEAGETETFDIRVSGTVDTDIFTGEEADCQIEQNEQGTGFLNEVELTVDENVVIETACPEDVSVDKVVVGDLVLSEDGNFSITYEIKVENSGEATSYDLKDTLKYGGGITPEKVVVKSDRLSSDLIFEEPGDDLTSELTIVTGETINQGEVHTYIVVVTGTFESDEITTDGGDCDLEGGESGTGFLNEATVEIDGGDSTDTACKPIDPETPENNNIFLEKIVVSGPDITGNNFVIDYQIRVTNNGEERANYDLSDELKYGKGLVINSSQVINVSNNVTGVTPPVGLDPGSKSEIVVGEEIEAGETETFDIRVSGTVDTDIFTGEEADCQIEENEQGTGFLNEVELTVDENVVIETACPEDVSVDKVVVGDLVLSEDGNFSITYEIKVENSGEATSYDLKDTLKYGGGITPEKVVVKSDRLSSDLIFEEPGDDLTSELTIVTGETINQGEVHTYIVVVTGTFDSDEITNNSGDCDLEGGESGTGFLNEATVEIDGEEGDKSEACKPIDPETPEKDNIFLEKVIISGPEIVDNRFEVEYRIDVQNNGEEERTYDLSDQLRYGNGLEITNASIVSKTLNVTTISDSDLPITLVPGEEITIVTNEPILPGDTESFVGKVEGTVDTEIFIGEEADCQIEQNEQGTGFLNEVKLVVDENETIETACPEEGEIDLNKVANPGSNVQVGDTITYTLVATNTGTVDLRDVTITDPMLGGVLTDCTPVSGSTLKPQESMECIGIYEVTDEDVSSGSVVNTATVEGTNPDGEKETGTDTEEVPTKETPTTEGDLSVMKSIVSYDDNDNSDSLTEGDTLHYSIVTTNVSDVIILGVEVTDEIVRDDGNIRVPLSCNPSTPADLDPGDSITCTGSYTLDEIDVENGKVLNEAVGSGTDSETGERVEDKDSATGTPEDPKNPDEKSPSIDLSKLYTGHIEADNDGLIEVGEELEYLLLVTNTGDVTLVNVEVIDPLISPDPLSCPKTTLRPLESMECGPVTYVVQEEDIENGFVHNEATANGTDSTDPSREVTDKEDVVVEITDPADLTTEKSVTDDGDEIAEAGEVLTYTIKVTNNSSYKAQSVEIKDSLLSKTDEELNVLGIDSIGGLSVLPDTIIYTETNDGLILDEINPGETVTITYELTVLDPLPSDITEIINVVTDDGTTPEERCIEPDPKCTVIETTGEIKIEKNTPKEDVLVGDIVPYTLTIENLMGVYVEDLYVEDTIPAGFIYIENSAKLIRNGEKEDIDVTGTRPIIIGPFDLEVDETVEITYNLKVGVGVVEGEYKNIAVVTDEDGNELSNKAEEKVYVNDSLFACDSFVIGKVWHDIDEDGWQDKAEATGLSVLGLSSRYEGSTITYDKSNEEVLLEDVSNISGLKLPGKKTRGSDPAKIVIRRPIDTLDDLEDITITTKGGTKVTLTANGNVIEDHKGQKSRGMTGEDISITREVFESGPATKEVHDIKIETVKLKNIIAPVYFDSGYADIRVEELNKLEQVLSQLSDKENLRLHLVGHTDSQRLSANAKKRYADNYELSEDRARQVGEYLGQKLSLPPSKIQQEGRGPDEPVAPNDKPENMQLNRRTEIEIWYDIRKDDIKLIPNTDRALEEVITIANNGVEERGLPGVRLATVEGLLIETDAYGRYHIEDCHDLPKAGENYIVKVDPMTLPQNSYFTTENPRVKRLGHIVEEFNFGVKYPQREMRKKETVIEIEVGEVFFDTDSDIIRSDQIGSLRKIADELSKYDKGVVTIVGNTDGRAPSDYNIDLGKRRAENVRDELRKLLGDSKAKNIDVRY